VADSWVEKIVQLKANTVTEVSTDFGKLVNTVIVKNLNQVQVYGGLKSTLSTTDYEIQVQPGDYGIIVRPYEFQKVYLLATADITLTVYLVWTQNPMILLPNMAKPVESTNVDVVKTVGLKASELNLDGNKNLGVNVQSLPSLPAGTNNIGKVDVNSLPDVNPAGWTWAKVTAAAEGDVTVKASAGKVAMLVNDSTATIMLKDGANQAWKAGEFIGYGCPLKCLTSIVVNFSAAGTAWILYQ
jgi:hypothetical protein